MAWASLLFGILTLVVLAGILWAGEVEAVVAVWLFSVIPAILGLVLGILAFRRARRSRFDRTVTCVGIMLSLSPALMYFVIFHRQILRR